MQMAWPVWKLRLLSTARAAGKMRSSFFYLFLTLLSFAFVPLFTRACRLFFFRLNPPGPLHCTSGTPKAGNFESDSKKKEDAASTSVQSAAKK